MLSLACRSLCPGRRYLRFRGSVVQEGVQVRSNDRLGPLRLELGASNASLVPPPLMTKYFCLSKIYSKSLFPPLSIFAKYSLRQLELNPSLVAKIPLLAADNLDKPTNPRVVNSVRLSVPEVDLFAWRDRSAQVGTAHTDKYAWTSRNSYLGPIAEDGTRSDRI